MLRILLCRIARQRYNWLELTVEQVAIEQVLEINLRLMVLRKSGRGSIQRPLKNRIFDNENIFNFSSKSNTV